MNDLYQETILDELRNPHNYGELVNADVQHSETNASCGDEVTVFLYIHDTQYTIQDIRWIGTGCAISQASMSFVSQMVTGKTVSEVGAITQQDLEAQLGIEEITIGRVKCLMLGLNAVKKAIALSQQ